jgi:prevent-host-death family protein
MAKTIKVGDLRRNSAEMIDDVEAGDEYVLTRNGREVARVVPAHVYVQRRIVMGLPPRQWLLC